MLTTPASEPTAEEPPAAPKQARLKQEPVVTAPEGEGALLHLSAEDLAELDEEAMKVWEVAKGAALPGVDEARVQLLTTQEEIRKVLCRSGFAR